MSAHRWSAAMRAPFALLALVTDGRAVTELAFRPLAEPEQPPCDAIAEQALRELERYLADPQLRFGVPLAPRGTPFQHRVWRAISAIPCGETRAYGELASALDAPARSIGRACGDNPIALMIPCHRVVAKGAIGGFMHERGTNALSIKRWLLAHEAPAFRLE